MLALVLAAAVSHLAVTGVQPVRELTFTAYEIKHLSYAADERFEYLGTPGGLYRTESLLDPAKPLELIAFAGEGVRAVGVNGGALYVIKGVGNGLIAPDHTLMRSIDQGATFQAIDEGLNVCDEYVGCGYLTGNQIAFGPRQIFAAVGGNVVVSDDNGQHWSALLGKGDDGKPGIAFLCGEQTFALLGDRLFIGSELCVWPGNDAQLGMGTLAPSLTEWRAEPAGVSPALTNKDIWSVRVTPSGTVFVGVAGGLLKSDDYGNTFRAVLERRRGTIIGPSIKHVLVTGRDPNLVIGGGLGSLVMQSFDGGETWKEATWMLVEGGLQLPANVALLAEDRSGQPFIAMYKAGKFTIAKLLLGDRTPRRRAADH
jgi:hypothetical protein